MRGAECALAKLSGEIVAYLDDDNIMHPHWLKSVAWAFTQRPETKVLYGAFLIDDVARVDPRKKGELPRLFFRPYNHQDVAVDNIADANCIAHRARLPEAHFDESLR
jgi:Glycosyl transferase family 2